MAERTHEDLRRLVDLAIAVPADQRTALLDRECRGDAGLRDRIEAMIAAAERDRSASAPTADARPPSGPGCDATTIVGPLREGPGTRIGAYKILQLIGEGGFGSVFMAEQEKPVARTVALKIIKLGMDTGQVVARFEQERQALAIMDHPNIAKVLDAGATETGRPYFVMELCKGEPISEYCDKYHLSINERLELFAQVCAAVQHAHTKGIIHRDLKPSNILVASLDGRPSAKVIDFGIAKATASKLTERTLFTEHRQLIGTPEYMSPEQADGTLDIDTRTDVYSLGVLLYELLTGSTPFASTSLRSAAYAELQRIIREVDPPKPSTRLNQNAEALAGVAAHRRTEPRKLGTIIRGELDWIVMKALEKDRSRRYETANGLGADVRRFLTGEAVLAAPPGRLYRVRKLVRRHKGFVAAGAAVAAAILIGSGIAVAGFVQANRERDRAVVAQAHAVDEAARAARAEATAVSEAQSATQIADFLASMLKGVGPQVALGRDTTLLREILDNTGSRVEKELSAQPEVCSRLLLLIANVSNNLAEYDKAERLARRALDLAKSIPGDNRTAVARALTGLAAVLESIGKYDDSKATYRESYEMFQAVGAGQTEDGLTALSGVGGVCYRLNDIKGAEPIFREVLEGRRALAQGADNENLASSLERLAVILPDDPVKSAEAETLERESLAMRRRLFGEFHPDVALSLSNLSSCLSKQNRFDEALAFGAQSVEQHRKLFGERNPRTASAISVQAWNFEAAGRLSEAVPLARLALDINQEMLGANHRTTLNGMNRLAALLNRVGDYAGAEEQYRGMLAWGRANYAPGDNRTSAVIMLVAKAASNQGRHADAEVLLREALEARLTHRPAGHPQITESRNALAECLIAQHKHSDAEPLLLAVEADSRAPDAPAAVRADAMNRLAAFYTGWNTLEPGKGHDTQAAEWNAKGAKDGTTP